MYHFELVNTRTGERGEMSVPEEMTIEDFCRELRCEMGLPYTLGSRNHLIIDNQDRIFMQDEEVIVNHVDMLWGGGDDPNDPDKKGPMYREDSYFPENEHTLQDLFPQVGANILYGQDYDRIGCKLIEITEDAQIMSDPGWVFE